MRRKRTIIDAETGEVLDGVLSYFPPKRRNGFGEGWLAMGQYETLDVLIDEFGRLEDVKVFFVLLKHLTYDNHISAKQVDIAHRLGMHATNVSRAMRRLMEMGAIFKGSRPGYPYRLNPEFGWKGSAKNHVIAIDQHREERTKAVLREVAAKRKETEGEPTKESE